MPLFTYNRLVLLAAAVLAPQPTFASGGPYELLWFIFCLPAFGYYIFMLVKAFRAKPGSNMKPWSLYNLTCLFGGLAFTFLANTADISWPMYAWLMFDDLEYVDWKRFTGAYALCTLPLPALRCPVYSAKKVD